MTEWSTSMCPQTRVPPLYLPNLAAYLRRPLTNLKWIPQSLLFYICTGVLRLHQYSQAYPLALTSHSSIKLKYLLRNDLFDSNGTTTVSQRRSGGERWVPTHHQSPQFHQFILPRRRRLLYCASAERDYLVRLFLCWFQLLMIRLVLLCAGARGLQINDNFVKFTAIGVYLEDSALPLLASKWKGKSAEELTESVEFFRDIVTGNGPYLIFRPKCIFNHLIFRPI